ncbi:hypothetical protein PMV_132 [Port-miou virus]|uniref:MORN repeat-containing protein n=1 Tax=Port-miou virus TaxID=1733873 RepID=A0A0N9PYV0_9VIRU|nr:hypothetical protein PMV_132 [Port-miou virus]
MQKFLEKSEALSFSLFEMPKKESFLTFFQDEKERYFFLPNGRKHGVHVKEWKEDKETKIWKDGVLQGEWKREKRGSLISGEFVDGKLCGKVIIENPYYRENLSLLYKEGFPVLLGSPGFRTEFIWDIPNRTLVVSRKDKGNCRPMVRTYSDISFQEEEDEKLPKGVYLSSFCSFDNLMTSNGSFAVVGKSSNYCVSICFPVFPN